MVATDKRLETPKKSESASFNLATYLKERQQLCEKALTSSSPVN